MLAVPNPGALGGLVRTRPARNNDHGISFPNNQRTLTCETHHMASIGRDGNRRDPNLTSLLARHGSHIPPGPEEAIRAALVCARAHLGMAVSFLSEFTGGRRVFRYVDAAPTYREVQEGDGDPLEESYCARIVDGRLPELIADTRHNEEALSLAITTELPIGSHISVPVRFSDGEIYGTLTCFDPAPNPLLMTRDVEVMRMLSAIVSIYVEATVLRRRQVAETEQRIRDVLDEMSIRIVVQPIVALNDMTVVGYEALARIGDSSRPPDVWFRDAQDVNLGAQLEIASARKALARLGEVPPGRYISLNLSPRALVANDLLAMLFDWPLDQIVIELTELVAVDDFPMLTGALARLQQAGARIAVNDIGSGYTSLSQIMRMQPDLIKVDPHITASVADDPARQALVSGLTVFASKTGAALIAERVERAEDVDSLRELGVNYAQGYYLGRPLPTFVEQVRTS